MRGGEEDNMHGLRQDGGRGGASGGRQHVGGEGKEEQLWRLDTCSEEVRRFEQEQGQASMIQRKRQEDMVKARLERSSEAAQCDLTYERKDSNSGKNMRPRVLVRLNGYQMVDFDQGVIE
eukprot:761009-Hanusia_phi.AAC.1